MIFRILLFMLLPLISEATVCWPAISGTNRYNADGQRHGRWVYYWDDAQKMPMNRLRFKNGREYGLNRYYEKNGKVWLRFRAFSDGRMNVTYFDGYGRREKKGKALMIYDSTQLRYCWHGRWKFYENGRCIRKTIYEMGAEISPEE